MVGSVLNMVVAWFRIIPTSSSLAFWKTSRISGLMGSRWPSPDDQREFGLRLFDPHGGGGLVDVPQALDNLQALVAVVFLLQVVPFFLLTAWRWNSRPSRRPGVSPVTRPERNSRMPCLTYG